MSIEKREEKIVRKELRNATRIYKRLEKMGDLLLKLPTYSQHGDMHQPLAFRGPSPQADSFDLRDLFNQIDEIIKVDRGCLRITSRDINYDKMQERYEEGRIREEKGEILEKDDGGVETRTMVKKSHELAKFLHEHIEKLVKEETVLDSLLMKRELTIYKVLRRCKTLIRGRHDINQGATILNHTLHYVLSIVRAEWGIIAFKIKDLQKELDELSKVK